MAKRTVTATRPQQARRRLAQILDRDPIYLPEWIERTLCLVVAFGHTPIHHYGGVQCAWCDAKMPNDAPDTMPRGYAHG